MLVNMKGSMIGFGAILAILIVGSFVIIFLTESKTQEASLSSREGQLISFGNYGHFLVKMLDQSIYFISQKTAYDLGKTGGVEGPEIALWDENYPKLDVLRENLGEEIKNNLPSSRIQNGKRVIWGDSEINVITDSMYFSLKGTKSLSIYDDLTESVIILDYEIDKRIDSNYFKLLEAGRAIFEDSRFKDDLGDHVLLRNKLNSEFGDLAFNSWLVEGSIVEISIRQYCYPSGIYCLAPLKPDETGLLGPIPYDYVELRLRYDKEQTGFTDPDFNFILIVVPDSGSTKAVCP